MLWVLLIILSEMTALRFAKGVTLLLFVIGSVLLVDGILSITTRIDRTWARRRYHREALALGVGKVISGIFALTLVCIGLAM